MAIPTLDTHDRNLGSMEAVRGVISSTYTMLSSREQYLFPNSLHNFIRLLSAGRRLCLNTSIKYNRKIMKPTLIDYRNVKYQGFIRELQPEGVGLGLDERMHFIASNWHEGMMDGRSVVFYGHCKYNYGEWRQGLPHGLNVFRMGDTIVFACYDKGVIIGEFLVIF
jgi:hypothetical protein